MKKIYLSTIVILASVGLSMAQNTAKLEFEKIVDTRKSATLKPLMTQAGVDYLNNTSASLQEKGGLGCTIDQDFEAGFPAGWNNLTVNANENWEHSAANGNPAGCMTIAYDAALGLQNESIITPAMNLSTLSNPTLKFDWLMSYYWGVTEDNYDLTVSITTNSGVTWTPLWTETDAGVFTSYVWYTKNIDLSAYASATNAAFRFNYNGIDGAQASLDNISVCTAQSDLRVDVVLMGDIINDYAYSQIPVSQSSQIIAGLIYSNVGATTLTNVSIDAETLSFVNGIEAAGTLPGLASIAPEETDTVWVATGHTPAIVDTIAQSFIVSMDQTDNAPLDNEGLQFLLMTADTWAHDYELEDYYAFGYDATDPIADQGFEMGSAYFCQTSGGTIYAVDFALGSATTATVVTVHIYENSVTAGPVSSTVYDLQNGDLSTTAVNFINVPLDAPVAMQAGNVYIATIAIEPGDGADIIGNNIDDGDGGQLLYSASDDLWYNWTGLTTSMRLRVSSVVSADQIDESESFAVYPNPASNSVQLSFVPSQDEMINVDLISVNGAVARTLSAKTTSGTRNTIDVDLAGLSAGLYSIRLTSSTTVQTRTVVLQ